MRQAVRLDPMARLEYNVRRKAIFHLSKEADP
jgi:hypothetical protein